MSDTNQVTFIRKNFDGKGWELVERTYYGPEDIDYNDFVIDVYPTKEYAKRITQKWGYELTNIKGA